MFIFIYFRLDKDVIYDVLSENGNCHFLYIYDFYLS